jgi:prepilin-type processing-associated H-X9-DG protein
VTHNTRRGFALPDFLASSVIAITALGLALPAAQKARSTDDRTRCADRLRAIGCGAHGFADANTDSLPRDRTIAPRWGWNVEVLPHIGEEKLARSFDLGRDWWDGDNRGVAATRVAGFVCPASPHPGRTVLTAAQDGGKEFTTAPADYVGSAGAYHQSNDQNNLHPGAMHHRKITQRIRRADIQDGAAYTLLVVEMADKPNAWRGGKLAEDRSAKPQMPALNGQWAAPNWNHLRSYTADGNAQFGPCAVNCSNGASVYGFHAGGANSLFVDGSVRLLKAGLSQEMLVALVSIHGGEVLSATDF